MTEAPAPATTITVQITRAVAEEYATREMADSYVGESNPYARIAGPGPVEVTEGEARELLADALHYVEAGGPGDSLTIGQRSAYRMLAGQILRRLETPAPTSSEEETMAETAAPTTPMPKWNEYDTTVRLTGAGYDRSQSTYETFRGGTAGALYLARERSAWAARPVLVGWPVVTDGRRRFEDRYRVTTGSVESLYDGDPVVEPRSPFDTSVSRVEGMMRAAALDYVAPVGTTEVAERLGVKRATVEQWRWRADTGFPEPRWTVGGRPAWDWSDVEPWAKQTGRIK